MGLGVQGTGFKVSGFGLGVGGLGFRVQGLGFRVQSSGFRVQGSGFRVQGIPPADGRLGPGEGDRVARVDGEVLAHMWHASALQGVDNHQLCQVADHQLSSACIRATARGCRPSIIFVY